MLSLSPDHLHVALLTASSLPSQCRHQDTKEAIPLSHMSFFVPPKDFRAQKTGESYHLLTIHFSVPCWMGVLALELCFVNSLIPRFLLVPCRYNHPLIIY